MGKRLQDTEEYQLWVADEIVLEREIDKPLGNMPSTLLTVTKNDAGYTVYRTFPASPDNATVSADMQNVTAEEVFAALLDKYSQRLD